MNVKIKILMAVLALGFIFYLVQTSNNELSQRIAGVTDTTSATTLAPAFDKKNPNTPDGPKPSPSPSPEAKPLFRAEDVAVVRWTFNDTSKTFEKKRDGTWSQGADAWAMHRRLFALSKAQQKLDAKSPLGTPIGNVSLKVGNDTWAGEFDLKHFHWTTIPSSAVKATGGGATTPGIGLELDSAVSALLAEGLWGLHEHQVDICDPAKIEFIELKSAKNTLRLRRTKSHWNIESPEASPARGSAVETWLQHACKLNVGKFMGEASISKLDKPVLTLREKSGPGFLLYPGGDSRMSANSEKSSSTPPFKIFCTGNSKLLRKVCFSSSDLESELDLKESEFKDPSLEEARIALDEKRSLDERVAAIRKIKDLRSEAGIPALKELVFQTTEIDSYRYEAVDALAAIGTRETYKIIADRLEQVGRTGFQLRLARALALSVGYPFSADEKTPDPERQQQIHELLDAFRKR